MGEENSVENGAPNGGGEAAMAPQEDSSKMPLTGQGDEAKIQLKENAGNGDAKIDVPVSEEEEEFRGLTKEELLEYSKKPFWVRLRIFLMFLFWAGWVAMLVLAVFIIVRAPQCEPPPTLLWLQESPVLQVDPNYHKPEEMTSLMEKLGLTSFYIPGLISFRDFYQLDTEDGNVAETVRATMQAMGDAKYQGVTDWVPNPVHKNHPWVTNSSYSDIVTPEDLYLNYSSPLLETELQSVYKFWQMDYNVSGFLISDPEYGSYDELRNLTLDLNDDLAPEQIVVGARTQDMADVLSRMDTPGTFKEFAVSAAEDADWSYYMYNPVAQPHQSPSAAQMPGVTLSLMLLPGTPLLQVSASNLTEFEMSESRLITNCVKLRMTDAIKFGETQFVNSTSDDVIAFTRTRKGTPGYAVTVNLGRQPEVVDFSDVSYVPQDGTLVFSLNATDPESAKLSMASIEIGPHEGRVIQFVAKY